jgi:cysteinyl-tRNA synthetase
MRLLDSLSGKKISVKKPGSLIKFFVCGPTVYDKTHIGHARTYIAFDALVRYLRFSRRKVFYLVNITDVDDKIIAKAKENKKNPFQIAKFYEKDFHKIEKLINITSVTKYAQASKHIKEIISQISVLIKKGFAYQTSTGVYFEVKKFKDYGKLSKQNLEALRPGWRIDTDPEKKDPLDFALWKKVDTKFLPPKKSVKEPIYFQSEPLWKSPWGWGRPGWHIEDTAITQKYFGVQYDIHGGASELKFPHHESEIAQQEAASGKKPLVKIWVHTGVLLVNGQKMSKSLKNFITVEEFLSKYSSNALRLLILNHSYHSPIDYTEELARIAQSNIDSLLRFIEKLNFVISSNKISKNNKESLKDIDLKKIEKNIKSALDDDFNTPKALGIIFDLISRIEKTIFLLPRKEIRNALELIRKYLEVLGFVIPNQKPIPKKISKLAAQREQLRKNKQFIQADDLRNKINQLGYNIEDTPVGPFIYKK